MKPKLSIITVCRNAREDLLATKESVFSQTCGDFEWIVVDGDSTDGTFDELSTIEDPRLRILSEADAGIYDAMNKGLHMAEGEWVWFLNAGDRFNSQQTIEVVLRATGGAEIVFGDAMVVDASGTEYGLRSTVTPHRLPKELCKKDFARGMLVSHQSFVVLRALAPAYGAERFQLSADLDWMLKILAQPRVSRRVESPLSSIVREGATMRHWKRSQWERFLILSRHFGYTVSLSNHLFILWRRILHGLQTRFWR